MHTSKTLSRTIVALTLATIALGGNYFLYGQIKDANTNAAQSLLSIDLIADRKEEFSKLEQLAKERGEQQKSIERYFIKRDEPVKFLEIVEMLADVTGAVVVVDSISESEGPTEETAQFDLNVTVTGNFDEVYYTTALLETLPYQLVFNQTQLVETGIEGDIEWRGTLEFSVLAFKK